MQPHTPEEYQEEMMRLYRYRAAHPASAPAAPPEPEPEPQPTPMPQPQPVPEPTPEPQVQPEPIPAPAQPEIVPPDPPQAEQTATGFLQVITRSAGSALALPGVSVLITSGSGKQMRLIHVTITDESGETEKIALPAPEGSQSLDKDAAQPPFSTYDVSVYAAGYYRQVSEQVPVFAGITSRQVFSMIPLVSDLQAPPKPIVFQNSEPGESDR